MRWSWVLVALPLLAAAGTPPSPAVDQLALLRSGDAKLARNKQVVFDLYRKVIQAGHVELGNELVAEDYVQHNPEVKNGRDAFLEFVAARAKPTPITELSRWPLVSLVAEGDLVVISFVRTLPYADDPKKTYSTTWLDMFRVRDGKVVEHWDHALIGDSARTLPPEATPAKGTK